MVVLPIGSITPALAPAAVTPAVGARGSEGFADTLARAVSQVNDLQLEARDTAVALAAGAPLDSAKAFVAIEQANVSFQFALQVRNKLLEAYQEIMRMTV